MLYTVLGLYDPAELAIDSYLVPSHHGFCALLRIAQRPAGCPSTRDRLWT